MTGDRADAGTPGFWTLAVLGVATPLVGLLCLTLWRMPFPLSEAVAIFEDVEGKQPLAFLTPTGSYYRPLFYITLSAIWHATGNTAGALTAIRFLHIVPVACLVVLFVRHVRPTSVLHAGAATVALSALVGSQALLGNLELPLSYTIIGMPLALIVWMLLERDYRRWHGAAIVLLTIVAVGFKEQGLVLVPLVLVAWWMRAPGIRRGTAVAVAIVAVAYVFVRLGAREGWPPFEQNVGFGFSTLSPDDAQARFGSFPPGIYAYNAASTAANLLFSEPTDGVFRIVRDATEGRLQPWEMIHVLSSSALTALVAWWGVRVMRTADRTTWSPESRACAALVVAVLVCGALSFDYSRDRLGGMALVPYALAAYFALRSAAERATTGTAVSWLASGALLLVLAGAWQLRADYTLEFTRQRAVNSHREWLTDLRRRRVDFANQRIYVRIMEDMVPQGTAAATTRPTNYPRWLLGLIGE